MRRESCSRDGRRHADHSLRNSAIDSLPLLHFFLWTFKRATERKKKNPILSSNYFHAFTVFDNEDEDDEDEASLRNVTITAVVLSSTLSQLWTVNYGDPFPAASSARFSTYILQYT